MNRLRLCAIPIAVVVLAGAALGASPAAQASVDLIVNGTFASSLAGWQSGWGDVRSEWSPESASADGTGSARLISELAYAGEADVLSQCLLVTPGAHLLQLKVRVPSGQPTTGFGRAKAAAYANTVCSGSAVSGGFYTPLISANAWSSGWIQVHVPAGAASLNLQLLVLKEQAGGEFHVLADAVQLRTGLLFADGFGSGTTAQWSAAVP